MDLSFEQMLQLAAWVLTVAEFILALYILLLNVRHTANRHVGSFLLLLACTNFAMGLMMSATNATRAAWSSYLLAALSPAAQPGLFLIAMVLLKPQWLQGRWGLARRLVYVVAFLPIVLTLLDLGLDTGLWYTGIKADISFEGFVPLGEFTQGSLGLLVRVSYFYVFPLIAFVPLLHVVLRDKKASALTRQSAYLLLVAQIAIVVVQIGVRMAGLLPDGSTSVITNVILVVTYAYAAFRQMISARRLQKTRLQTRLTVLLLGATLPLVVFVVGFVNLRAGDMVNKRAIEQIEATNRSLTANVSLWLDLSDSALKSLVASPAVISMDPEQQKPLLEALAEAYPHMSFASITDWAGMNIARSDNLALKNYRGEAWQFMARNTRIGDPLTVAVSLDEKTGQPILVAARPIRSELGAVLGVAMFASSVSDITQEVLVARTGKTGFAYIVDHHNRIVAHPDPSVTIQSQDFTFYPPVLALGDTRGLVTFTDEEGVRWRAFVNRLEEYRWGIIVQQQEGEFTGDQERLGRITFAGVLFGGMIFSCSAWLTIRQSFVPIKELTDTAAEIAAGNLERKAAVESQDEIGLLAASFNSMTGQLHALISDLERQVDERTRDLERRSAYLEAAADVGGVATTILETDRLINEVVELIRSRFDLYYVGLFLLDEAGDWAILRAGTGEAGQKMLERSHRIKVGAGMIGWSVANAQWRVALQAGEDAVRLSTPELPDTSSEAALPLRSRGQVLGALTVQDNVPGTFDHDTMVVLQTMSDQVAAALENARLFAQSQEALEAAQRAYGELSRQAWKELLHLRTGWGYRYNRQAVVLAEGPWPADMRQAARTGQSVRTADSEGQVLAIPVRVRGDQVVGVISLRKGPSDRTWNAVEIAALEDIVEQLGLALEGAQLHKDAQQRAAQEQLIGEVSARMRQTLDIETVLKTAAQEVRQVLELPEVIIRLVSPERDEDAFVNNGRE